MGIQSFVGTAFELRQSLARGRLHQQALFEKYDVYGPPKHDPLLEDEHPGADPFDTEGEYCEMNVDTMEQMLARAPLWRLRRQR